MHILCACKDQLYSIFSFISNFATKHLANTLISRWCTIDKNFSTEFNILLWFFFLLHLEWELCYILPRQSSNLVHYDVQCSQNNRLAFSSFSSKTLGVKANQVAFLVHSFTVTLTQKERFCPWPSLVPCSSSHWFPYHISTSVTSPPGPPNN